MAQLKQAYIAVENGGAGSFGGSQMWLDAPQGRGRVIAGAGCGLIAAADLFLYLAKHHPGADTPTTAPVSGADPIARTAYLAYIDRVSRRYTRIYAHIGMTGFALADGVNRYFADHRLCYRARWKNLLLSGGQARRTVERMLQDDLPVILSIPGAFFRTRSLNLYRSAHTELPREKERAYRYASFGGHYVTVTAVEQNGWGEPVYAISSWGRKYYLDLAEYTRAAKRPEGVLACGLLEVDPTDRPAGRLTLRVQL